MSRSKGVQDHQAGLRTRFIFWLVKRKYRRMDLHVASPGTVPLKLKELAQVKVAMMVGCPG
jgi:hypothetical protein